VRVKQVHGSVYVEEHGVAEVPDRHHVTRGPSALLKNLLLEANDSLNL